MDKELLNLIRELINRIKKQNSPLMRGRTGGGGGGRHLPPPALTPPPAPLSPSSSTIELKSSLFPTFFHIAGVLAV